MTYFLSPVASAAFRSEQFAKSDLARGAHLLVGLNCFEPGQSQPAHVHGHADKFYLVLSGKARISVGDESGVAEAGQLVWAPAGVRHGVDEAVERTVLLVVIAPAPKRSEK